MYSRPCRSCPQSPWCGGSKGSARTIILPACNALLHGDRGGMVPYPPTLHLLAALEENKLDNNSKWRGSAAPDWGPSCRARGSREREAVLMRRFFCRLSRGCRGSAIADLPGGIQMIRTGRRCAPHRGNNCWTQQVICSAATTFSLSCRSLNISIACFVFSTWTSMPLEVR